MNNPKNQFELDDFNLNSDQNSWENQSHMARTSNRETVTSHINQPVVSPDAPEFHETAFQTSSDTHIDITMPPGAAEDVPNISNLPSPEQIPTPKVYDQGAVRTTSKLDEQGVKAVNQVINKLSQDGNVADFYETAREMMEVNLSNSYNRKIGQKG